MAKKYRIEEKVGSPASLGDLNQWLKEGYELVSAHSDAGTYTYYLIYKGGIKSYEAIRRT